MNIILLLLISSAFSLPHEEVTRRDVTGSFQSDSDDPFTDFSCSVSQAKYFLVPDPRQCDRFMHCANGVKSIKLCEDGFGVDVKTGKCELLARLDCGKRKKLQTPSKANPNCPRLNGYFELPGSCNEYIDCRSGQDFTNVCPAGTIFDAKYISCVHPDQSERKECRASAVLNFTCPSYEDVRERLRFGDHDRLPHPDDCSKFYACLLNGQPRLSSCKKPNVFNPESGFCESFDKVKGCEKFYSPEDIVEEVEIFTLENAKENRQPKSGN